MDAKLLAAIQGLIRLGNELHAEQVAKLERTVAARMVFSAISRVQG